MSRNKRDIALPQLITLGCGKIEINSDNSEVVSALKDGISFSVAGAILNECYFMALDFTHVICNHCNRENNHVAHELARIVRFSLPNVWMGSSPEVILRMV